MSDVFDIKLTDLLGEQRELAELIGLETYIKLVRLVGGSNIYIAKEDKLMAVLRNRKIKEEFDGGNIALLKNKYRLSERSIRNILNNADDFCDPDDRTGIYTDNRQLTIYDYLEK